MATRMQQRRGSSADWTAANEVLPDGAVGIEEGTGLMKIGDGVTGWNDLTYANIPMKIIDNVGDLIVGGSDNVVVKLARGATDQVLATKADGTLYWITPPVGVPLSTVVASGDLIIGSGSGAVTRLAKGANNQVLAVVAGALSWISQGAASIPLSTVTAAGDLIVGSGSGAVTKLAKGSNGNYLTIVGGALTWLNIDAIPISTMVAGSDLVIGAGAGAVTRLPVGASGKFLGVSGSSLAYLSQSADVALSLFTAAGDLAVGSGSGTVAKLAKGANGQVLGVTAGALTWVAGAGNFVVCTSSTHPASPYSGLMIWETDTQVLYIYDGSQYQFVPTNNQQGPFLKSAAGNSGRLVQRGSFTATIASGAVASSNLTYPNAFFNVPTFIPVGGPITGTAPGLILNPSGSTATVGTYLGHVYTGTYSGSAPGYYIASDA